MRIHVQFSISGHCGGDDQCPYVSSVRRVEVDPVPDEIDSDAHDRVVAVGTIGPQPARALDGSTHSTAWPKTSSRKRVGDVDDQRAAIARSTTRRATFWRSGTLARTTPINVQLDRA